MERYKSEGLFTLVAAMNNWSIRDTRASSIIEHIKWIELIYIYIYIYAQSSNQMSPEQGRANNNAYLWEVWRSLT